MSDDGGLDQKGNNEMTSAGFWIYPDFYCRIIHFSVEDKMLHGVNIY